MKSTHGTTKDKARKVIAERNLGAVANDTKWSEFFSEVIRAKVPLEFKLIHDDEPIQCGSVWTPVKGYIEGGPMGPYQFIYVEWVKSRMIEPVVQAAKLAGLEVVVEDGVVVVYGYR